MGRSKIDALAGIKYVLDKKAAIGSVFEDEDQRLVLTPGSGSCNVYVAGASRMTLSLVDLQGRALRTIEVSGDNADISTDGLTRHLRGGSRDRSRPLRPQGRAPIIGY